MMTICNKFDLGQEIYFVTKVQQSNKKRIWVAKENPVKIVCIHYKAKIQGDTDILYNIFPYGKAREENMFLDYQTAMAECNRRNTLEAEQHRALRYKK